MNASEQPSKPDDRLSGSALPSRVGSGGKSSWPGRSDGMDRATNVTRKRSGPLSRAHDQSVHRKPWMLILRLVQRHSLGFLLVCFGVLSWWAGNEFLQRTRTNDPREKPGYSPPLKSAPPLSPSAKNNNANAALGLAADLEGTAVFYREEVARLVRHDGEFRIDLSLDELATILKVDRQTIAKKGSSVEVDPDAVLFTAVAARQTEKAKAQARRDREIQVRMGMPASAVGDEWQLTKLTFSLNDLIRPDQHQMHVLYAIRRSALHAGKKPGAKFNAEPFLIDRADEQPAFAGGYLPLEAPPSADDEH